MAISEFEKASQRRKDLQSAGEVPEWYTTQGLLMFERKYAYEGETVREAFVRISSTLAKHYTDEEDKAEGKFFDLLWKGFLAPSTPVMCNTGTNRGLVVSCAGSYFEDSISGFYKAHAENAMLSKLGFGTSSYLGDVRPRGADISTGGHADGIVPVFDTAVDVMTKVSQGANRRGQWAGYLDLDHEDFWELAGYVQKNVANSNVGWNIPEEMIDALKAGDEEAIRRWNKAMYLRCRSGKGYFWKPDTANRLAPEAIKRSGITIKGSNLCAEIALPQDELHTFSCVLSSLNLAKWDEFDRDTVFWSIIFLDCVVSEMLKHASKYEELEKIIRFTEKSRALGLGTMGFHTYLQLNNIAFEELKANYVNTMLYAKIREESEKATAHLAEKFGEPEWCKGLNRRNATLMAIAPNMSSAILCGGVSQGIEPIVANCFNQPTAAGEMTRINPQFLALAKEKDKYSEELMDDLAKNYRGSVQHLDWLTAHEKRVFKTAYELDQKVVVRLASSRQKFIDQGQSLNLFFGADADEVEIAEVHKYALLDPYIKGLYYLRSERGVEASKGDVSPKEGEGCLSCEG